MLRFAIDCTPLARMPVDKSLFARLSLFHDLPDTALALLSGAAHTKRFAPLHLLMAHHTTPAFLIVVLRGQLQKTEVAEDGRITGIGFVNPGEVLDWLSVVDGAPIICSVNATQETDVLLLPIQTIQQLLQENPMLANRVLQQLALDVRRNTEQRQLLTLPNAHQRVFVQIVQLAAQHQGQPLDQDCAGANLPKQHEIAAMVNTSRETVSRAIQMLVKKGILVKHGHRFVVQHADQLKQLAATGGATPAAAHRTEKR